MTRIEHLEVTWKHHGVWVQARDTRGPIKTGTLLEHGNGGMVKVQWHEAPHPVWVGADLLLWY